MDPTLLGPHNRGDIIFGMTITSRIAKWTSSHAPQTCYVCYQTWPLQMIRIKELMMTCVLQYISFGIEPVRLLLMRLMTYINQGYQFEQSAIHGWSCRLAEQLHVSSALAAWDTNPVKAIKVVAVVQWPLRITERGTSGVDHYLHHCRSPDLKKQTQWKRLSTTWWWLYLWKIKCHICAETHHYQEWSISLSGKIYNFVVDKIFSWGRFGTEICVTSIRSIWTNEFLKFSNGLGWSSSLYVICRSTRSTCSWQDFHLKSLWSPNR
jgi:hypothetical protein